MSNENDELSRQIARLAGVVDELARASLVQANATNMLQQVLREFGKDFQHVKDRVEFIAQNTEPKTHHQHRAANGE
jgi:hypothetical protein